MKILILHGPNLNMLGKREPEIYGDNTLENINNTIEEEAKKLNVETDFFQSNSESDIVSKIQGSMGSIDGIVINPAAYTHTSIAIRDAILSTDIPTVEVHISNIYKREEFRQKSFVSGVAVGVVSGFGIFSYILGLNAIVDHLKSKD